jgi:hypothetical protein
VLAERQTERLLSDSFPALPKPDLVWTVAWDEQSV